jgi:hypothetical protein
MGQSIYPAPSSGGIKNVQRGVAAAAGSVTITAVDMNKSFVTCFGTASSGTLSWSYSSSGASSTGNSYVNYNGSGSGSGTSFQVGTVQGYLSNSTTLVVSGPCRWEIAEFN